MVRDESFLATLRIALAPEGFRATGFDCGESQLTDYICDGTSADDQASGVSRSYLVYEAAGALVGYFSLQADSIRLETKERPDGVDYPSAPAIKVGRMGVQQVYRGRGVGSWILDNVAGISLDIGNRVGVRYATLDAIQRPKLIAMYEEYGFVRNRGERRLMAKVPRLASWRDLRQVSMRYDIRL